MTTNTDEIAQPLQCVHCYGETKELAQDARYQCVNCDNITMLGATEHAVERYVERVTDEFEDVDLSGQSADALPTAIRTDIASRIRDVWTNARVIPIEETEFVADEMRFHDDTELLLLRKDTGIVTVVDAPSARTAVRRAVMRAVVEQGAPPAVITSVSNWAPTESNVQVTVDNDD